MINPTAVSDQSLTLAASFNELAKLFCAQQKYGEAEALYLKALDIDEHVHGADNVALIPSLSRLGIVYRIQEKFDLAEPLYLRALAIAESNFGPEDMRVAVRLNYLSGLYVASGKYHRAETLVQRSLQIYKSKLGAEHRVVGLTYMSLALIKRRQGEDTQADQFFEQFHAIAKNGQAPDDQMILMVKFFYQQGRYDDAELLFRYALLIGEEEIWPNHPLVADALNGLARWQAGQQNYQAALPLYERVLKITEGLMGTKHPTVEPILRNYAIALHNCNRAEEANSIEERADNIRAEQHFPANISTVVGDRYVLIELLGKGGMSTVYKARHKMTNKIVAVKMLNLNLLTDKNNFRRFHLEAKASSALNHPNIIAAHDFGTTSDGIPYLVMDFVEGKDLNAAVKAFGTVPLDKALDFFLQCCDGLAEAHKQGIVHRDLKPGNIMIARQSGRDVIKIVDLGIAKLMPKSEVAAFTLTQTGELVGSPAYMSPEQSKGIPVDQRADIYSFGCVMYEILSGQQVFTGNNALDVLYKHLNEQPIPIETLNPELKDVARWDQIILRCLQKEPEQRFQSMLEVKAALEALKTDAPVVKRPLIAVSPRALKVGVAAVAIVGVAALAAVAAVQIADSAAKEEKKKAAAMAAALKDKNRGATRAKIFRIVKLAQTCHKNGECDQAGVFLKDALKLSEEVFGKDSPETFERVRDLALFYQSMDEPDNAAPYLERMLKYKGQK
jgi:tetratricopeptide (TPR) repeat protein